MQVTYNNITWNNEDLEQCAQAAHILYNIQDVPMEIINKLDAEGYFGGFDITSLND